MVEADHEGMRAVSELAAKGALRPHIEASFPLTEAATAHARIETGRTPLLVGVGITQTQREARNEVGPDPEDHLHNATRPDREERPLRPPRELLVEQRANHGQGNRSASDEFERQRRS